MAVCITLVTGRFGTVAVGNLIALLIEIDCSLTMSIMACVPMGECFSINGFRVTV